VGIGIAADPAATNIRTNPAFARMLALGENANASLTAPDQERPRHFKVFCDGYEMLPTDLPLQVAAREGRSVENVELEIEFDTGASVRLLEYAAPLFDEQGEPRGSVGAFVDITERVAAEQRFRTMADFAPALIWIADESKGYTWFNRPWLEFTGLMMADQLGFGWTASVHPDDVKGLLAAYNAAFDARAPFSVEYRLRRHDGEWRWLIDNGRPLFGHPGGAFSGYIGSCMDITEQRAAEEQRQRLLEAEQLARLEAERSSRMKDEFLASLSHELRTPLNAILGWTQVLRMKSDASELLHHGLETLERNAKLQAQLIDDLLDMTRILSGTVRLAMEPVDLAAVIRAAVDSVRPSADDKALQIETVLNDDVPPVFADPSRLQQVVWNLLANSVKFTPKGGHVSVILRRAGTKAEVTVADSGIGITPDFLPHVFDRFRQGDSSPTRRHGGLGIGLTIVKQLVDLHGGSIEAASAGENLGARFTVTLDLATSLVETVPDVGPRRKTISRQPSLAGTRVFVVEDDDDARLLLELILGEHEASVVTFGSASAALDALRHEPPDVIISDIALPDRDGYEFLRTVRGMGDPFRDIPALALTAFARGEDRQRAFAAGFQLHLAKPVEPQTLCSAVARLTRKVP
jgi:PAS domain S-box-containing protein